MTKPLARASKEEVYAERDSVGCGLSKARRRVLHRKRKALATEHIRSLNRGLQTIDELIRGDDAPDHYSSREYQMLDAIEDALEATRFLLKAQYEDYP